MLRWQFYLLLFNLVNVGHHSHLLFCWHVEWLCLLPLSIGHRHHLLNLMSILITYYTLKHISSILQPLDKLSSSMLKTIEMVRLFRTVELSHYKLISI